MNNFRKEDSRRQRQAMDGVLNASSRSRLTDGRELGESSLRTSPRRIGDFKRTAGYHPGGYTPSLHHRASSQGHFPKRSADDHLPLSMELPGEQNSTGGLKADGKGLRSPWNWGRIRKLSLRIGLGCVAALLLVGGFLFAKGYLTLNKVFKGGGSAVALRANVNPSLLKGEGDGRINIMLTGRGGDGHEGADLTDTILLASIDPVNKKAVLVSTPRDLWVKTPSGGSGKINAIFADAKARALKNSDKKKAEEAGLRTLQETLRAVLGVTIHYYGLTDFQAFRQAVDTVGGVDINVTPEIAVTERLWDPLTRKPYYLNVPAGQQHFDGQRALFYARSRHTSPRGDFDRAERQRALLQALGRKTASAKTYTNPVKVSQLMDAFGDHIVTDMSLNDGMRLMEIGRSIKGNVESIDFADPAQPLMRTSMISGQSVVVPVAGINDYSAIQAAVRSKLKDGYIVRENAQLTVLNGTLVTGLAGQKAEELRSYGYNVAAVADAPSQGYERTVLVDLTKGGKPYTKNYLEKRFGIKAANVLPDTTIQPGATNFVIILGQNETLNR